MKEGVSAVHINIPMEMRLLTDTKWLLEDKPTKEAERLISDIEKVLSLQKAKAEKKILGEEFHAKVKEYNEIFPKIVLPHGKAARSNAREVTDNFVWFFNSYKYDWETILKATENYVDEFARNNYKFMRSSKYFIRKQNSDRTWTSDLAEFCELVTSGVENDVNKFNDRVV